MAAERRVQLYAKVKELEVTAGEYLNQDGSANLLGILTKLGLSARSSEKKMMKNVANRIAQKLQKEGVTLELAAAGEQILNLSVMDDAGMESNQIVIKIIVL